MAFKPAGHVAIGGAQELDQLGEKLSRGRRGTEGEKGAEAARGARGARGVRAIGGR